jgi:hypothetical protein
MRQPQKAYFMRVVEDLDAEIEPGHTLKSDPCGENRLRRAEIMPRAAIE